VARDAGDVCLRCGMCCDGTLFPKATLRDDEADFARSLGLTTIRKGDGGLAFELPCPRYVGGCCSIHQERRPEVCGGYRCALLPAYEAGTMTLDECLDVVELMRATMRRLELALGQPIGSYQSASFGRLVDEGGQADAHDRQEVLVPLFRLAQLGVKYFGWDGTPTDAAQAAAIVARQSVTTTGQG
jgi:hypothetical protein